jgi:hypothetical protein
MGKVQVFANQNEEKEILPFPLSIVIILFYYCLVIFYQKKSGLLLFGYNEDKSFLF